MSTMQSTVSEEALRRRCRNRLERAKNFREELLTECGIVSEHIENLRSKISDELDTPENSEGLL